MAWEFTGGQIFDRLFCNGFYPSLGPGMDYVLRTLGLPVTKLIPVTSRLTFGTGCDGDIDSGDNRMLLKLRPSPNRFWLTYEHNGTAVVFGSRELRTVFSPVPETLVVSRYGQERHRGVTLEEVNKISLYMAVAKATQVGLLYIMRCHRSTDELHGTLPPSKHVTLESNRPSHGHMIERFDFVDLAYDGYFEYRYQQDGKLLLHKEFLNTTMLCTPQVLYLWSAAQELKKAGVAK